jgi:hypothetical protein
MPDGTPPKWIPKPLAAMVKGWEQDECSVDPGVLAQLFKVGILTE